MTIHREGRLFLLAAFVCIAALNALLFSYSSVTWINYTLLAGTAVLFLLFLQFFRLPSRRNTAEASQLVAPCDGKVVVIEAVEEPEYFKDKRVQVSIFMSPLNVHANWVPCEGEVRYVKYHPGLYLVAWHPKSSTENERTTVVIQNKPGQEVLLRQIAGAVARRIRYYIKPGDMVRRDQEFGFIKFGSRVDIFLPVTAKIHVQIGDKTQGNETVIASW